MDIVLAVLAVPVFVLLVIMNSVSANPQDVGITDSTVPFFLTLVSALSYSLVAFAVLHILGFGDGIQHLWLVCLPFSLILASAVSLFSTKKQQSPFGRPKGLRRFTRAFQPARQPVAVQH